MPYAKPFFQLSHKFFCMLPSGCIEETTFDINITHTAFPMSRPCHTWPQLHRDLTDDMGYNIRSHL
jgi:hypothetical protein